MRPDSHHYSSPILIPLALYHLDILFHNELSFAIWRGAIPTMRSDSASGRILFCMLWRVLASYRQRNAYTHKRSFYARDDLSVEDSH